MTFAFTQDVPINSAIYEKISKALGPEMPPGLLLHTAIKLEKGLRYLDVWESKEAYSAFVETTLHPVVFGILRESGIEPPEEPPIVELEVIELRK